MGRVRVQVMSRQSCHLCDVARDVVTRVCQEEGVAWEERDIDTDPELLARYADLVPVVLVDGEEIGHWRVDAGDLRRALASPAA